MSTRRKISIRKILQTLVTIILVACGTMAMRSADSQFAQRRINKVLLKIENPAGVQFLKDSDVQNMLFVARHLDPLTQTVTNVDERRMEMILRANPWVKDANIYTDADRVIHILLTQRVPLVRIFEEDGNSYYLDAALQAMPLSSQYNHYTPVITGVPHLLNDSSAQIVKGKILGLVNFLNTHSFWNAQVSQIEMRADGGFELVPILGNQRIILGDTNHLEQKLTNLLSFYKQIQNKVGWDRYKTLDLRFENQVVASPALQWKRPLDAAFTNMSWLKAIMDHAPASQNQLGGDATANSDSLTGAEAPHFINTSTPPTTTGPLVALSDKHHLELKKPALQNKLLETPKLKPKANPPKPSGNKLRIEKDGSKSPNHLKNIKPHAER